MLRGNCIALLHSILRGLSARMHNGRAIALTQTVHRRASSPIQDWWRYSADRRDLSTRCRVLIVSKRRWRHREADYYAAVVSPSPRAVPVYSVQGRRGRETRPRWDLQIDVFLLPNMGRFWFKPAPIILRPYTFYMKHTGASRKSPNNSPWEMLSQKLCRPIRAPLLTGVLS